MPAYRLVFLLAVVAGLLLAVATTSSQRGRGTTGAEPPTTVTTATSAQREPSRIVTARLPHAGPIRAHVGDLLALSFTRPRADIVELEAFGLRQGFSGDVPTVLRFLAARPGTFSLRLQQAGTSLAKLVVTPPRLLTGGTAPGPEA